MLLLILIIKNHKNHVFYKKIIIIHFLCYLSENGLKMTKQREEIFSEFSSSTGHFTVEDLYNRVNLTNEKIGIATVQRTLEILVNCNIARKIKIGNNITRYEHNHCEHYHLSCIKCKKLIEVKSYRMLKLIKELAMDENFKVMSSSVVISGICEKCMRKNA